MNRYKNCIQGALNRPRIICVHGSFEGVWGQLFHGQSRQRIQGRLEGATPDSTVRHHAVQHQYECLIHVLVRAIRAHGGKRVFRRHVERKFTRPGDEMDGHMLHPFHLSLGHIPSSKPILGFSIDHSVRSKVCARCHNVRLCATAPVSAPIAATSCVASRRQVQSNRKTTCMYSFRSAEGALFGSA